MNENEYRKVCEGCFYINPMIIWIVIVFFYSIALLLLMGFGSYLADKIYEYRLYRVLKKQKKNQCQK